MRTGSGADQRPFDSIVVPQIADSRTRARWHRSADQVKDGGIVVTADVLVTLLAFVIQNSYVMFAGRIFKQIMGIAMGTNSGPFIASLYANSYELQFLLRQLHIFVDQSRQIGTALRTRQIVTARRATLERPLPPVLLFLFFSCRYIDDIFHPTFRYTDASIWLYDRRSEGGADGIYPTHLRGPNGTINVASEGRSVHFLDVTVMFHEETRTLHYKLYDKRRGNAFFEGTLTFPDADTMLADNSKYKVLRSQMFRFDRNCSFAEDFVANTARLAAQMIHHRYAERRVVSEIERYDGFESWKGRWHVVRRRILDRLQTELA